MNPLLTNVEATKDVFRPGFGYTPPHVVQAPGRIELLGNHTDYLFQSHQSSRELLRNSCPELDLLVDLARRHPACLGARLTGGGFGGATVHLVRADQVESYSADLKGGVPRANGLFASNRCVPHC